jgi:hypothetical protein
MSKDALAERMGRLGIRHFDLEENPCAPIPLSRNSARKSSREPCAIFALLQSTRPAGRVTELQSLGL